MIQIADVINQGLFLGTLGTVVNVDTATTTVTTRLVDGLTATKTADKEVWVNGELTYTIVITNNSGEDYTDIIFTDVLDTALVNLVANSFKVNNVDTTYTFSTGTLNANVGNLANTQTMTIVFKVARV